VELGGRRLHCVRGCVAAVLTVLVVGLSPARAVEAINVRTDAQAIDLTDSAERHRTEADRLPRRPARTEAIMVESLPLFEWSA